MVFDKHRLTQSLTETRISTDKIFDLIIDLTASFILVVKNFLLLIFYPYKTMRKLSLNFDYYQLVIIFFSVFAYFKWAYFLKDKPYPATLTFSVFLINLFLTLAFFWFLTKIIIKNKIKQSFKSLIYTFSYSFFPTLIWFGSVSFLYILLPPPRTTSILGILFSIFFLTFSLTILIWKIILVFLSLRFSLKLTFYQIIYFLLLYLIWFFPYSVFLYYFRLFRIPFI